MNTPPTLHQVQSATAQPQVTQYLMIFKTKSGGDHVESTVVRLDRRDDHLANILGQLRAVELSIDYDKPIVMSSCGTWMLWPTIDYIPGAVVILSLTDTLNKIQQFLSSKGSKIDAQIQHDRPEEEGQLDDDSLG